MFVLLVDVEVKQEHIGAFITATRENARQSLEEPGVARFDVIQQQDEPGRFVLIEVYRGAEDPARHKETAHYQTWRDAVAPMMAAPRSSRKFDNIFPDDTGW